LVLSCRRRSSSFRQFTKHHIYAIMEIGLLKYLLVAISLLIISFLGIILNRTNIIIIFISIELMLLSINFNFIIYSKFLDDMLGQVFSLFFLTIGASESAIGLGILVSFYRMRKGISVVNTLISN
jgi:NADH-quinone oxidoreductase subunit K